MQDRIVLYGKIGSGKSTIAAKLAANLGYPLYSVDGFVHDWYREHEALLVREFGTCVRRTLMSMMQKDESILHKITEWTKMYVHERITSLPDEYVLEFPLYPLYAEHYHFDKKVWVSADESVRRHRVCQRDACDEERFNYLNCRQGTDATYAAFASVIIDNSVAVNIDDVIEMLKRFDTHVLLR